MDIRAKYDDAIYTHFDTLTFSVLLIDQCFSPTITVPTQTNPADYYYTYDSPLAEFTLNAFTINPSVCPVTYSCAITSGPRTDLCTFDDGLGTIGQFDPALGNYDFRSIDVTNYLEGAYIFQITGTTGTNSDVTDNITFTLTMINPCPISTLTLNASPFFDYSYKLRDSPHEISYTSVNSLAVNADTQADCGHLSVNFYHSVFGDLNSVFLDDTILSKFTLPYTENILKVGIYNIYYRVYYDDYPGVIVDQITPFVVTIFDPCDPPGTLELDPSTPLEDKEYFIGKTAKIYQFPSFNLVPAWCPLIYSFVSITPALPNASVVSFDPSSRTFTFDDQASDLSSSSTQVTAPYEVDYTIKI